MAATQEQGREKDMTEATLVRIALFIYSLLALFAVILLWRNAAAPDALKNSGVAIASILPLFILVLPYLNPQKLRERVHPMLIYDAAARSFAQGAFPNLYMSTYLPMFSGLSQLPDVARPQSIDDLMAYPKPALDIIEKGIIHALAEAFGNHWDVFVTEREGPGYTEMRTSPASDMSSVEVDLTHLRQLFSHNDLASLFGPWGLRLPPKGGLTTFQSNAERRIIIEAAYGPVTIQVRPIGASVVQEGIWGVLKPDPENAFRYYVVTYELLVEMQPRRLGQYSPERESYRRWYDNIVHLLRRFDWQVLSDKIDRARSRDAISKTLGQ